MKTSFHRFSTVFAAVTVAIVAAMPGAAAVTPIYSIPLTLDTTSLSPAPGAARVAPVPRIEFAFSDDVVPLTTANVQLCEGRCGFGVPITTTTAGRRALVVPTSPLRPNTLYEVRLNSVNAVTSVLGVPLGLPSPDFVWTFRTAADVTPPSRLSTFSVRPGIGTILLTWRLPASDVARVRIVRRTDRQPTSVSDPAATIVDIDRSRTAFTDRTVIPGRRHYYSAYAIDAAGNASAAAVAAVTALGTPTKAAVKSPLILPAFDAPVDTLRPVLVWKRTPGAAYFNVQVFEGQRKVLSLFPTGRSLRVPVKTLRRGKRYRWRVWPFFSSTGRYALAPLGSSFFRIAKSAKP